MTQAQPSNTDVNLTAYLERIGYAGPTTATLQTLRELQRHHAYAIPFENLAILMGDRIRLDLPSIERKLISARRGGYCFEHNTLLAAVLRTLGYRVIALLARVVWQRPADAPAQPRTHMLLRVELPEGPYLADVGFGPLTLTAPLRLDSEHEQTTPHETLRLRTLPECKVLQVRIAARWQDVYRFTDELQHPIDFELANWYTSTHPESRFVQNLVVSRVDPHARYVLHNMRLSEYRGDTIERQEIEGPEALLRVLAERFDLHLPPATRFQLPPSP